MTERTPPSAAGDDDAAGTGPGPSTGRPAWQRVLGLVGLAVVVVLVILLLVGDHGPGRHAPGSPQGQPADAEGGEGHDPARWSRS